MDYLPLKRKFTRKELTLLGLLNDSNADSTFTTVINALDVVRKAGAVHRPNNPWEWALTYPLELWKDLSVNRKGPTDEESRTPYFNAYKYAFLLFKALDLVTDEPDNPWFLVRKEVLLAERAILKSRVNTLEVKDVTWGTLYSIFNNLEKGSRERLWFAIMLLNPPMRNELVSLSFGQLSTSKAWHCRGFITRDAITLTHTKLTTRSNGTAQVIPMSALATLEFDSYINANSHIKRGDWIFKTPDSDKAWADVGLKRLVAKTFKVNHAEFAWLSTNVMRRTFCREMLPLIWLRHGHATMVSLNSLIGHSLDAVALYAGASRVKFQTDEDMERVLGPHHRREKEMEKVAQGLVDTLG